MEEILLQTGYKLDIQRGKVKGFRLWGLGFRGLGFRVWGLGCRVNMKMGCLQWATDCVIWSTRATAILP